MELDINMDMEMDKDRDRDMDMDMKTDMEKYAYTGMDKHKRYIYCSEVPECRLHQSVSYKELDGSQFFLLDSL
jgi:hypothetical protein